jgi:hypothetical protein
MSISTSTQHSKRIAFNFSKELGVKMIKTTLSSECTRLLSLPLLTPSDLPYPKAQKPSSKGTKRGAKNFQVVFVVVLCQPSSILPLRPSPTHSLSPLTVSSPPLTPSDRAPSSVSVRSTHSLGTTKTDPNPRPELNEYLSLSVTERSV